MTLRIDEQNSTVFFPSKYFYARFVVYNYYFRNYNLEGLELKVNYFRLDGTLLKETLVPIKDDESLVLDSKQTGFGEDVFVEVSIKDCPSYIKGIVRGYVDYYTDSGLVTSVHEQGAFWKSSVDSGNLQGHMNVICNDDITTYAIVQNTNVKQEPIDIEIRVFNEDGDYITTVVDRLNFREMKVIDIDKDGKAKEFLKNQRGHFAVKYSQYIGRAAYMQMSRDNENIKYMSVSHAAYYAMQDVRPHTPADYYQDDSSEGSVMRFAFAKNYQGFNVRATLYNDYLETKYYDLDIYDANGQLMKRYEKFKTLKTNQIAYIQSQDFADIEDGFLGLARIRPYFEDKYNLFESYNYELLYEDKVANTALSGSAKLNDPVNFEAFKEENIANRNSIQSSSKQRSRQLCRGHNDDNYESLLVAVLASSSKSQEILNATTTTKISFTSSCGTYTINKYITMKMNTVMIKQLSEILTPEELSILGGTFGIYVRNYNFKLTTLIVVRNKKTLDIGIDHFAGG